MPPAKAAEKKAIEDFTEDVRAAVNNQIQVEEAIKRATRTSIVNALSDEILETTTRIVEKAAFTNWRAAVKGIRILLAVLAAKPPANRTLDLRGTVIGAQIEIAARACSEVPDGRLFRSATQAGELLATEAEAAGNRDLAGRVLHMLGVLHLDPYLLGGQIDNYQLREAQWRARLQEEYGMELAGIPAEQSSVPAALDSLAAAGDYFRRALAYRGGDDRARTLKALAQACLLAEHLGAKIDRDEVWKYVDEALGLVKEGEDPAVYADLQVFRQQLGKAAPAPAAQAQSQKLLDEPLELTVQRLGVGTTLQQYSAQIGFESSSRTAVALALWQKIGPLVRDRQSAGARADHLTLGLKLIGFAHHGERGSTGREQMMAAANEIIAANAKNIDGDQAAAALVALAVFAPNSDSEKEGLQILKVARELGPAWVEQYEEAVQFLEARLHEGAGVNAYRAKRFGEATAEYIEAAKRFSELHLSSAALTDLDRARDVVVNGDDEALQQAIAGLGTYVTAIQAGTGQAGIEVLRNLFNAMLTRSVRGGNPKATMITFLWSIVKGAAFSAALQTPPAWRWDSDKQAMELLKNVALAEAAVTATSGKGQRRKVLSDEEVLVAYTAPDELAAGSDAGEILENAQLSFDSLANIRLLEEAAGGRPLLTKAEELQAWLDERTVLVNQLLGPTPDGTAAAIYTMLATREQILMTCGAMSVPFGTVILEDKDGKKLQADYLTLPVGELRRKIIENDPGMTETLESDAGLYLGGELLTHLANFRAAGKDHLCISPHGPTRYYPFHLLSPGGSPLADQWKVTYVPSMAMLSRPVWEKEVGARTVELRAFGVNWEEGNAAGRPFLPDAADEASSVAEQFEINAEVNEKATRAALLDALQSARMIHVATHGLYSVAAPMFQAICMSPRPEDDGVVKAYELVGLDLRGCDLITLSACSTALGRFDRLDNVRGLPATLFMAGANTIIGTLWPVESHCARYFYSLFYERLRAGDSKLDAFATAQASAREYYPAYVDWGAFYFAGRW